MIVYQAFISGYLLLKLDVVENAVIALEHTPHVFPDYAWACVSGMISILGAANAYIDKNSKTTDSNEL